MVVGVAEPGRVPCLAMFPASSIDFVRCPKCPAFGWFQCLTNSWQERRPSDWYGHPAPSLHQAPRSAEWRGGNKMPLTKAAANRAGAGFPALGLALPGPHLAGLRIEGCSSGPDYPSSPLFLPGKLGGTLISSLRGNEKVWVAVPDLSCPCGGGATCLPCSPGCPPVLPRPCAGVLFLFFPISSPDGWVCLR